MIRAVAIIKTTVHVIRSVHYRVHKSLQVRGPVLIFSNKLGFYSEQLLDPRPTPKLEDPPHTIPTCLLPVVHWLSP